MRRLSREGMRVAVTREVGLAGDVVGLVLFVDGELVLEQRQLAQFLARPKHPGACAFSRPVEHTLSDETDPQSSNGALHDAAEVRV